MPPSAIHHPLRVAVALIAALAVGMVPFLLPSSVERVAAQETISVISDQPRNDFPRGVTFALTFQSPTPVEEVRLRYELAPDGTGATAVAGCQGTSTVNCAYTLTSGRGIFVIPGAEITYHWDIELEDGTQTSTDDRLYIHEDTRFTFFQATRDNVTVHYHARGEDEAQAVLQAAVETLRDIGRLAQTQVTFPIKVFLYATAEEMQPAIVPTGGRGVQVLGEVVYSDTAMVSADVDTLDITRHEIAHIVTREATKGPFGVPGWLNEGISVYAQRQPLAGHDAALQSAIRRDQVLTWAQLNAPSTGGSASTVGLYYGQAGSIVRYLVETYGEEKFAELLRTFKDGSRVDSAFEKVYGFDGLALENQWRASVGLPARSAPVATATPDEDQARGEATSESGDGAGGASASSDGDGGMQALTWGIIGVLGLAVAGTAFYSASVIRSRL